MGISTIAGTLQDLLGQKLMAVIAGVSDARAVGEWARGTRMPHPKAEERLRNAYQVAKLLEASESPETVRAWFIGMNPELGDHPPALVIAEEPVRVLQAARAFLAHG
ncbi:MAG: XRE family transcriptional regulator [Thermomicrobiales bacterium]